MMPFYKLFGAACTLVLLCTTPLLATEAGSKAQAKKATVLYTENTFRQELFIIAPPDIDIGVDWEECQVLIPHEDLGTPTIPENCNNCTISRDNEDDYYEYYQYYYPGTTTITWTVTDAFGNQASDTQDIRVSDTQPPYFPPYQPDFYSVPADPGECRARVEFSEPGASDNCDDPTISVVNGNYASGQYFPVGTTEIRYEAVDASGNTDYFSIYIYVEDTQPPVFTTTPEPITRPADPGTAEAVFDLEPPQVTENCTYYDLRDDAPEAFPVGTTLVTWYADDYRGNIATITQEVTITYEECPAFDIGGIELPEGPQPVNTEVLVSIALNEMNEASSITWLWGDGSQSAGTQEGLIISGTHRYTSPGMYTVEVYLENECGETSSITHHEQLTIYIPSTNIPSGDGFITGGGWFYSPAGAWQSKPAVSGKAHFNLNSKKLHQKGTGAQKGTFGFKLQKGGLDFRGTSQEWLQVEGHVARYSGMGTLNGISGYRYLVSVVDGSRQGKKAADKIRVIIWDAADRVVYDNEPGAALEAAPSQAIGGGAIVIHEGKGKQQNKAKAKSAPLASRHETTLLSAGIAAYPNPLGDEGLWLAIPAHEKEQQVKAVVYDLKGRVMAEQTFSIGREGGRYQWQLAHHNWASGIYLLQVQTEAQTQQLKILK